MRPETMRRRETAQIDDKRMLANCGKWNAAENTACLARNPPVVLGIIVHNGWGPESREAVLVSPYNDGRAVGRRSHFHTQRGRSTTPAVAKTTLSVGRRAQITSRGLTFCVQAAGAAPAGARNPLRLERPVKRRPFLDALVHQALAILESVDHVGQWRGGQLEPKCAQHVSWPDASLEQRSKQGENKPCPPLS